LFVEVRVLTGIAGGIRGAALTAAASVGSNRTSYLDSRRIEADEAAGTAAARTSVSAIVAGIATSASGVHQTAHADLGRGDKRNRSTTTSTGAAGLVGLSITAASAGASTTYFLRKRHYAPAGATSAAW
jgi:hypothetical protein